MAIGDVGRKPGNDRGRSRMTRLAIRTTSTVLWAAVVERHGPAAVGRPAEYGPMHAARRGSLATACGLTLDSGRRPLSQVTFGSIADAASTMVCGDCRRAVQRDPEGLLG
ncbi:hypothetical protein acdb102_39780 [Acidothermaceae bacterium B102]|nr:hypothetical protein acdb102_39780 [Acidothermaceae bacterium B102]